MQYDIQLVNEQIDGDLKNYIRSGLKLWKYQYSDFNMYIFSIVVDEEKLLNYWEDIRNKVALYFQSNLEKEIELWNIYIIFFVENSVAQKELKYKVENDHYCARKIVLENVGNIKEDETKIKEKIIKKLFELKIPEPSASDNIEEIEAQINLNDSRLTNIDSIRILLKEYKD